MASQSGDERMRGRLRVRIELYCHDRAFMTQYLRSNLDLMVREIEATPEEYWGELLESLRLFRVNVAQRKTQVVNPEQLEKNQAAIALLQSWADEDSADEDAEAWQILKTNLDADRLSDRPLFL